MKLVEIFDYFEWSKIYSLLFKKIVVFLNFPFYIFSFLCKRPTLMKVYKRSNFHNKINVGFFIEVLKPLLLRHKVFLLTEERDVILIFQHFSTIGYAA